MLITPAEYTYSFKYCHQRLLVVPQDPHDILTSNPEAPLDVAHLHRIRQHSSQSERHSLRILVTMHGDFEAVTKINVNDLASDTVQHQIRWMSVAKAENISNH